MTSNRSTMRNVAVFLAVLAAIVATGATTPWVAAQAPAAAPQFEVASVKPNKSGGAGSSIRFTTGQISMENVSLKKLTLWSYGIPDDREYALAGPDWLTTERFDILARFPAETDGAQVRRMAQSLLADRFKLARHPETRQLATYVLVVAKNGTKLGQTVTTGGGEWKRVGPGLRLEFRAQTMADLAAFLSTLAVIDRPVVDGTGLDSAYTFVLDLNEAVRPGDTTAPSVSTLLQEQLGVRLEAGDCHWR